MERELLKTPKFTVVQKDTTQGTATVICHPGAVVILPLLDQGDIVLITNRRQAVDKKLIELPAGTLETGESPLETAKRELAEETGYRCTDIEPLFDYYVSPGILNEKMHAFVASGLTAGATHLMDDEEIETVIAPLETAIHWIQTGKIEDAKTIATLLYYSQFCQPPKQPAESE